MLPIFKKEVKLVDAVKLCPHGKRSLERWVAVYREYGEAGLEPKSTRPKTNPNETPIRIKEKIIELRKGRKQCALKIMWDLQDEGINMHYQTIQKIIKKENLTRKYKSRKARPNYVRIPLKKGEIVEIDVKFVPGRIRGKKCYQFTAIDCASRWRHMQAYRDIDNISSLAFLKEVLSVTDFKIVSVKTDNASIFTNRYLGYDRSTDPNNPRLHPFDILCNDLKIIHYLIDPGKPAQNGKVERSHRTDQEKFYDGNKFSSFEDLKQKMKIWNNLYNNTKHCGLNGKTPNEALKLLN